MNLQSDLIYKTSSLHLKNMRQYSTFIVAKKLYAIDVSQVQEVVRSMPITRVPLAPKYLKGLLNLRGQVATAIGLRELFHLNSPEESLLMNVVCRHNDILISLLVDEIGDVIEIEKNKIENSPQTIPLNVRSFMDGVFNNNSNLLSILNLEKIINFVNQ